jgi:hypothetical protein
VDAAVSQALVAIPAVTVRINPSATARRVGCRAFVMTAVLSD